MFCCYTRTVYYGFSEPGKRNAVAAVVCLKCWWWWWWKKQEEEEMNATEIFEWIKFEERERPGRVRARKREREAMQKEKKSEGDMAKCWSPKEKYTHTVNTQTHSGDLVKWNIQPEKKEDKRQRRNKNRKTTTTTIIKQQHNAAYRYRCDNNNSSNFSKRGSFAKPNAHNALRCRDTHSARSVYHSHSTAMRLTNACNRDNAHGPDGEQKCDT